MSREELIEQVRKLRNGIRRHRDSSGHELCWHHPDLWALLPEKTDPIPVVPEWPQFMAGCIRYRQSLDTQAAGAPRSTRPYDSDDAKPGSQADSESTVTHDTERNKRNAIAFYDLMFNSKCAGGSSCPVCRRLVHAAQSAGCGRHRGVHRVLRTHGPRVPRKVR
jgi:hypothetical protein